MGEKLQTKENEHVASVKKELALKVKKVRVDSDKHMATEQARLDKEVAAEREAFAAFKREMDEKIDTLRASSNVTDQKAEAIFKEHREQWRARRRQEVEAKGVQAELNADKETTALLTDQLKALEQRKADAKEHLKKAVQNKLL